MTTTAPLAPIQPLAARPIDRLRCAGAVLLVAATAGCTSLVPSAFPPGTSIAQVRGAWVQPTGAYAMADGGTRLEYARGEFGRETVMLDFDAGGRLVASTQVLTPAVFATIKPGFSAEQVRRTIGRPARVINVGWQQHAQVWNYRYAGGADCVWFQVSIADATGRVTETGEGYDPACDGRRGRD
jgi:hypothetical protein